MQRVERLLSGSVHGAAAACRGCGALISNIEVEPREGERRSRSRSNFILGAARAGTRSSCGRAQRCTACAATTPRFKIAAKKVLLINSDQEMPLLQFLI